MIKYLNNVQIPIYFQLIDNKVAIEVTKYVIDVKFSFPLQYVLGFQADFQKRQTNREILWEEYKAEFNPNLKRAYNHIYIYCNVVEPRIVGNVNTPLLRTINLPHTPKYEEEVDFVLI